MMILAVAATVFVLFVFMAIWASRFAKVGPNQVLIVSGRKVQLPDGRSVGFRIVKRGGTFVFPIFERADALSLEVIPIDMPSSNAQTSGGQAVQADCAAQVKVKSDDASIMAAAEHFLNKSPAEIATLVRPLLEKHLSSVLASSNLDTLTQNPAPCAALVQDAAAKDLAPMGLSVLSFTLRNPRPA